MNLVLTSPTALPTSSIDEGICPYTDFAMFCISSKLSPVAPVFSTMISIPLSIVSKDAVAAAPTARIGVVTFLVNDEPALLILPPASCIALPAFAICCCATLPNDLYCSSKCFSSLFAEDISRSRARIASAFLPVPPSSAFNC